MQRTSKSSPKDLIEIWMLINGGAESERGEDKSATCSCSLATREMPDGECGCMLLLLLTDEVQQDPFVIIYKQQLIQLD